MNFRIEYRTTPFDFGPDPHSCPSLFDSLS
jgi:hypothetical protein